MLSKKKQKKNLYFGMVADQVQNKGIYIFSYLRQLLIKSTRIN